MVEAQRGGDRNGGPWGPLRGVGAASGPLPPARPSVAVAVISSADVVTAATEGYVGALGPGVHLVPPGQAEILLLDTFGVVGSAGSMMQDLVDAVWPQRSRDRRVVLFTGRPLVAERRPEGWSVVSKRVPAAALVGLLARIRAGHEVVDWPVGGPRTGITDWPGRAFGLSERESEVVLLVGHGLVNAEIADELMLGAETVKTHLRRAYRKLAVRNRTAAIVRLQGGLAAAAPVAASTA